MNAIFFSHYDLVGFSRYIHIGPRLALLLTQTKEVFDELEETTSCCSHSLNHSVLDNSLTAINVGLNRFWPANATLMVCSNSLHAIGKNCLPKNVILMEYGFQVLLRLLV